MRDDYDWTPHLLEGEEVLWQGRPDGRAVIWSLTDFASIAGILFAFAVFGTSPAMHTWIQIGPVNVNPFITMIAFVLIAFLFKRFRNDLTVRKHARYAITTQRALVADTAKNYLVIQMHLSSDLKIFEAGRWYRVVAFTNASRKMWLLSSGMFLDGPPLRQRHMMQPEAVFRGLPNADEVASIAVTAATARS